MPKTSSLILSSAEQRFLHGTRLFDGVRKPYVAKTKNKAISLVVPTQASNKEWDQEKHEKELTQFFQSLHYPSKHNKKGFFTCPYCLCDYNYWSKHVNNCTKYTKI